MEKIKQFSQRTFASLKIKNYRLYFTGQAISLCGTWMQTISQDWLVLKLTGSGTQLGLVSAVQFLPILIFGPFGGVIADRFDKRKLLYFTQIAAGILALILGTLVVTNSVHLWMVYVLAACLGFVNTIDNPTRQTFLPEMVGKESLSNAITLNATEVNLARAVGPALAGIVIASAGLGFCFLANGFSYIAVIIMLYMMDSSALSPAQRISSHKGQLMKGFRYVRQSAVLFNTLIMLAIIGTLSYEFSVILPLFAEFTLHGGAGTYAALVAMTGIGSVVGGLFTASRKKVDAKLLVLSGLLFGITFSITAFMPNIWLACLMLFFVGIFSINFISIANAILQLASAPEMRGRVMALWSTVFLGSTPIGGPIIGVIGEDWGPRWGILVGGIAAIGAAIMGTFTLLTKHERTFAKQ